MGIRQHFDPDRHRAGNGEEVRSSKYLWTIDDRSRPVPRDVSLVERTANVFAESARLTTCARFSQGRISPTLAGVMSPEVTTEPSLVPMANVRRDRELPLFWM